VMLPVSATATKNLMLLRSIGFLRLPVQPDHARTSRCDQEK
jgi:hypothetical protein